MMQYAEQYFLSNQQTLTQQKIEGETNLCRCIDIGTTWKKFLNYIYMSLPKSIQWEIKLIKKMIYYFDAKCNAFNPFYKERKKHKS